MRKAFFFFSSNYFKQLLLLVVRLVTVASNEAKYWLVNMKHNMKKLRNSNQLCGVDNEQGLVILIAVLINIEI